MTGTAVNKHWQPGKGQQLLLTAALNINEDELEHTKIWNLWGQCS